jgi:hypothetical protein
MSFVPRREVALVVGILAVGRHAFSQTNGVDTTPSLAPDAGGAAPQGVPRSPVFPASTSPLPVSPSTPQSSSTNSPLSGTTVQPSAPLLTDPVTQRGITSAPNKKPEERNPPLPITSEKQSDLSRWSVGAGVIFGSSVLSIAPSGSAATNGSSLGIMSGAGMTGTVTTPTPLCFLELRLTRGLFTLVQAEGFYNNTKSDTQKTETASGGFSLAPGLRWTVNPEGLVEVGMAHIAYYTWGQSTTHLPPATSQGTGDVLSYSTTATTASFGTATAIVAERKLLSQLWLRVAATVFRAGWSKTVVDYDLPNGGSTPSAEVKAINIRFSVEPSLSLRLVF